MKGAYRCFGKPLCVIVYNQVSYDFIVWSVTIISQSSGVYRTFASLWGLLGRDTPRRRLSSFAP